MAVPARSYAAFATVMLAFFMAILDTSIVNITLPAMTDYFKTDIKTISWVANGFNLAFAVLLITASRLADQFGRKKIFCIGLFFFTLTSYLSGIASSDNLLIFYRVLQGLSAAVLVPVTLPIVLDLFPVEKSGTIVGVWAAIAGLAAASGPALGGILIDKLAWQWIFFINIPIGCATLLLTAFLIRESYDPTASHYVDWQGMVSLTAAVFPLVYAMIKANDLGWTSRPILTFFALSAFGFVLFVLSERRSKEPMLPLKLLHSVPFSASNATLFMLGMGMMNGIFFLAFFLTQVMGMTELKAGLVITALPLSSTIFSGIAGPLSDRLGSRWFAVSGMAILALSVYINSGLRPQASNLDIIWRLMVTGAGIGIALAPVIGATIRAIPSEKIGIASGVGNMTRTIGTVLGVAVIVTVFTHTVERQVEVAKTQAIALVEKNPNLKRQIRQPIVERLRAVKFNRSQRMQPVEATLHQIDEKKRQVLESVPPFMQKKVAATFDQQKAEVRKTYPAMQAIFKERICDAFASTFRINSVILILGIILAFFCEPWKR